MKFFDPIIEVLSVSLIFDVSKFYWKRKTFRIHKNFRKVFLVFSEYLFDRISWNVLILVFMGTVCSEYGSKNGRDPFETDRRILKNVEG